MDNATIQNNPPYTGGLPIRILFQNIRGLNSKRSKIISSDIPDNYDILLFNESFVTKEHALVDDWACCNFIAKSLTFRDSSEFKQGNFVAFRSNLKITYPKIACLKRNHEISIMKLTAPQATYFIILAYRSPSMKPDQTG